MLVEIMQVVAQTIRLCMSVCEFATACPPADPILPTNSEECVFQHPHLCLLTRCSIPFWSKQRILWRPLDRSLLRPQPSYAVDQCILITRPIARRGEGTCRALMPTYEQNLFLGVTGQRALSVTRNVCTPRVGTSCAFTIDRNSDPSLDSFDRFTSSIL
jgi:hypothetical protein